MTLELPLSRKTCNIWPALGFAVLCLFFISSLASAQLVNGRFISSVYTWEKFDTVDVSKTFVRGFQSILLDIAQDDFSLHTHIQGGGTFQKDIDQKTQLRAFYLYGQWKNIGEAVDFSFGRLPFYAGVGSGTLDGMLTTLRVVENKVRVRLYGGANVPTDLELNGWKSLKNNFVVGGQILTTAMQNARIGASVVSRSRERDPYWTIRPDSLFNPVPFYATPLPGKEQYASLDASYQMQRTRFYARYDYNLLESSTQRAQVRIRHDATDDLSFSGEYIHRDPRIPFSSFFSVFAVSSVEEVEGGVDLRLSPFLRTFVRGAYVSYEGDESFRYTVGATSDYVGVTYRGNSGYAGELNAVAIQGSYPLLDRMVVPTVGFSFSSYKLSSTATREDAIASSLGAVLRPVQSFSVNMQAQWLKNRIYGDDVRLFGRLSYWFSERLSLFE
jgi:hypothetical protein